MESIAKEKWLEGEKIMQDGFFQTEGPDTDRKAGST